MELVVLLIVLRARIVYPCYVIIASICCLFPLCYLSLCPVLLLLATVD